MTETLYRVSEAAALVGVSDDTVRRWADAGRLGLVPGPGGRLAVVGSELARVAREQAGAAGSTGAGSAGAGSVSERNRFSGIVTAIVRDTVMAQVDVQAGPFRVVSLISREAADELGLEVGSPVVASAKATNVSVTLGPQGERTTAGEDDR
ncbi:TOBE domain-containing protein [Frigoribacterium faeni]|uniref:TOBE domain-containing protein n=1 Tax=Frigoribacterium faeni TaxID=145483 RepID=UPI00141BA415|nr:TOBE domain-containing protein [Frigoribacterium faeni]NIJ05887.1 molybdopterin-binding protein [Frigoribacterium faeni]